MLRLDYDQYDDAVARMAMALQRAEDANMRTTAGRAMCMLEALGNDFDVAPMDPGPANDVAEGNVWPEITLDDVEQAARDAEPKWLPRPKGWICEHCDSVLHSSTEHDSVLMERILGEIAEYNRKLVTHDD